MAAAKKSEAVYRFEPVGYDVFDRRANQPERGTLVVKTQPAGCPRNGTMGHCFVKDAESGEFYGLVLVNSLVKVGRKPRAALDAWTPAPLDHPAVRAWVNHVLCYFRDCYRGPGEDPWVAGNLSIDASRDPVEDADDHAGVNYIRRYYPEFAPTADDFAPGGYGQKAEVVWHADVETPAALEDKIRNSDLVRLSDAATTIRRVSDVKTPMTEVTFMVAVDGEAERRAYSAEQAARWALRLEDGV